MKIPTPVKTPTGWRIQLRLGGKSIIVRDTDKRACIRKAEVVKSEYRLNGKLEQIAADSPTLYDLFMQYNKERNNVLSPASIKNYDSTARYFFPSIMPIEVSKLTQSDYQLAVNAEYDRHAPNSVKNAVYALRAVVRGMGYDMPAVKLRRDFDYAEGEHDFLEPEEIPLFVEEAAKTPYCIPLLLALSSMRLGEIMGITWQDLEPTVARVRQVSVEQLGGGYAIKQGAKNRSSVRDVELFIPQLSEAISKEKPLHDPSEPVVTWSRIAVERNCVKCCERAGVTQLTPHGLRHSFASLSCSLGIPEHISQRLGGWANNKVMKAIYTHAAARDIDNARALFSQFYSETCE